MSVLTRGTVLDDKYRLLSQLGEGGMGEVWVAKCLDQLTLKERKHVVIKVVRADNVGSEKYREYFEREIALSMLLGDGGVVTTFGWGEHQGLLYAVMEWVRGANITKLRDSGVLEQLDPKSRCSLASYCLLQLMLSLQYVHNLRGEDDQPLGVVHRDICPANLLVSVTGDLKLSDFGIARIAQYVNQHSGIGLKGKIRYMCRLQMQANDSDPRVDLFATGAVIYEMLTGEQFRRDYRGDAVFSAVYRDVVPKLPDWARESPIYAIYERLMALEYRHAADVVEELERATVPMMKGRLGQLVCQATRDDPTKTVFGSDPKPKPNDAQPEIRPPSSSGSVSPKPSLPKDDPVNPAEPPPVAASDSHELRKVPTNIAERPTAAMSDLGRLDIPLRQLERMRRDPSNYPQFRPEPVPPTPEEDKALGPEKSPLSAAPIKRPFSTGKPPSDEAASPAPEPAPASISLTTPDPPPVSVSITAPEPTPASASTPVRELTQTELFDTPPEVLQRMAEAKAAMLPAQVPLNPTNGDGVMPRHRGTTERIQNDIMVRRPHQPTERVQDGVMPPMEQASRSVVMPRHHGETERAQVHSPRSPGDPRGAVPPPPASVPAWSGEPASTTGDPHELPVQSMSMQPGFHTGSSSASSLVTPSPSPQNLQRSPGVLGVMVGMVVLMLLGGGIGFALWHRIDGRPQVTSANIATMQPEREDPADVPINAASEPPPTRQAKPNPPTEVLPATLVTTKHTSGHETAVLASHQTNKAPTPAKPRPDDPTDHEDTIAHGLSPAKPKDSNQSRPSKRPTPEKRRISTPKPPLITDADFLVRLKDGVTWAQVRLGDTMYTADPFVNKSAPSGRFRLRWRTEAKSGWRRGPIVTLTDENATVVYVYPDRVEVNKL